MKNRRNKLMLVTLVLLILIVPFCLGLLYYNGSSSKPNENANSTPLIADNVILDSAYTSDNSATPETEVTNEMQTEDKSEVSTTEDEKEPLTDNEVAENEQEGSVKTEITEDTEVSIPNNEVTNTDVIEDNKYSDITIVIDPGHASKANLEKEPISPGSSEVKIKDGGGATGASSNIPEYKTCMSISTLLCEQLKALGFNVIMTKTDNDISLGNVQRAEIGNNANADLVIRIHADSATSNALGASMLVPKANNERTSKIVDSSYKYGETIINTYCDTTGLKNRGLVSRDDLTGFNWSEVPVVLLEMGFLSNPTEDNYLSNVDNHSSIAEAICNGIVQCFD